jgi:hypothetical protein
MKKTYFMFYTKNIFSVLCSLIKIKLGYKYSEDEIPDGPYCYKLLSVNKGKCKIKKCIYYKTLPKGYNSCNFLGLVTDDIVFDDQCKACGIKEDYRDEVKENREEKLNIILNNIK